MMETKFYSYEEVEKLKKKQKVWSAVLFILIFSALSTCVTLVAMTTRMNENMMRLSVMIISAVFGVAAIYIASFPILSGKRAAEHSVRMLEGEAEYHVGTLEVSKRKIKIKNSITIRRVTLRDDDGEVRLNVRADLADLVPTDGGVYTVSSVHGYVTWIGGGR